MRANLTAAKMQSPGGGDLHLVCSAVWRIEPTGWDGYAIREDSEAHQQDPARLGQEKKSSSLVLPYLI